MKTNHIQKNTKKTHNHQKKIIQNSPIKNDTTLKMKNTQNLLGQTMANTTILEHKKQTSNNIKNYDIPQIKRSNSLKEKKSKNTKNNSNDNFQNDNKDKNIKMRNSEAYKLKSKLVQTQNKEKLQKKGLYEDKKKLNAIVKNGKLIRNIDINEEIQESIKMTTSKENEIIELNIKNNNNLNQNKPNTSNVVGGIKNEPNENNVELIHQINNNPTINSQFFPQKTVKSIMLNTHNQNLQNKHQKIDTQNVPLSLAKSSIISQRPINELNQRENIIKTKQVIPCETVQTIYNSKETNQLNKTQHRNPLSQIIPDQTVKSIYKTNTNLNPSAQIIPTETVKTIYGTKNSQQLNAIQNQNPLSKIMPNETVKSIYPIPEESIKKSKNCNPDIIPNETVKTIYQENKNDSDNFLSKMAQTTHETVYPNK